MAEIIRSSLLADFPHGFSGREGLSADEVLPASELCRLVQTHSADVVRVRGPIDRTVEGDALVTDLGGLLLGIVTADCAPVLFADPAAKVIGAAHAGWRGAHGGVLENTLAAMEALGASRGRIVAAIGPTIAQASYEVDQGFRAQFAGEDARFFAPGKGGRLQFDLPAYVAARLERAGIGRAENLGLDTYADPARFHSYRRATHRAEPTEGRQLSVIGLRT